MGIFRRFGGNTTEPQVPTASKDTVREENNPARNKEGIVTIEYGTGYPIDVIYAYIGAGSGPAHGSEGGY